MSVIPTDWNNEELIRAAYEVSRRAQADEAFMKLAISDGTAALARVDPKPLPAGVVVKFVDNRGPLKTIPLPPFNDAVDEFAEITEEELEAVAGGVGVEASVYCSCASITVTSN